MSTPLIDKALGLSRRQFLSRMSLGMGSLALSSLLMPQQALGQSHSPIGGIPDLPHFAPKAKRVIYLFQSGGPSHLDLFQHKPLLQQRHGQDMPASVLGTQRLTGMTAGQKNFPLAGSHLAFQQYGQSGAWMSELLPHTSEVVDDLCFIHSMYTEAINHDPAITFFQTGSQLAGRPSIGAWLSYGLGHENQDLPAFMVLLSRSVGNPQPVYARLWGSAFLPSQHQGVQLRSGKDPVLYLANPSGLHQESRRNMLNRLRILNERQYEVVEDPEIQARIAQYEMAYRMQSSVPEVMDIANEPEYIYEMYGEDVRKPGTYAANCLLARRLAERGVRFIQLYHMGWDAHGNLPAVMQRQCKHTDQPTAALIKDLKQRGLLEDTLVIWGGEFGRTAYCQGNLTPKNYGRDHHPGGFTLWMAGGGVKPGMSLGQTDEFGYNAIKRPVHVHDFQATLMHLMGIDHERFTFKHQGRRYRLTDVQGKVVKEILA